MNEYRVTSKVKGTVTDILDWCVIVQLTGGKLARIPRSEVSWSKGHKHPRDLLSVGEEIEVIITGVDKAQERISLSLKAAKGDPWKNASTKYPEDSDHLGIVVNLEAFGVFVELEDGVEGLVPIDELGPRYMGAPEEVLSVSDKVRVVVTAVDQKNKRIDLSVKEYLRKIEKEGGKKYLPPEFGETTALGDKFAEILQSVDTQRLWEQQEVPPEIQSRTGAEVLGKILVIDDEADVGRSFGELARAIGYDTDIAFSGQSGLQLALDGDYSAIITDIDMPGMNGIAVMERIRERKPDSCIIFFSGTHILRSVSDEDRMSASGILTKPVNADRIHRTITEAINGAKPGISAIPAIVERELVSLESLARPADHAEEISQSLSKKIQALKEATGASACAVFEMDPLTKEVDLVASIGIEKESFENAKYRLRYSPVSDVIMEGERLFCKNIHATVHEKFQYLFYVIHPEFDSCIGLSMIVLDQRRYGLFLFHPASEHFTELDLLRTETAAGSIASTIERKQVQNAIEGSQRLMLTGQVLSGLSHDIRNRLDVLSHYSDLVVMDIKRIKEEGYRTDREDIELLDEHVREIIRGKDKTIGLAEMFLQVTKEDKPQFVDIFQCIQRIKSTLDGQARHANALIDIDIDEGVKHVKLETRAFEQILLNLVLNALQHIENESITHGKVQIKAGLDGKSELPVKIRVSDNGPGIHRKHFERIFDFGFSTRPGGAGMGLYLCKQLAERLGGRITVEDSVIFLGTTFLLEFPEGSWSI